MDLSESKTYGLLKNCVIPVDLKLEVATRADVNNTDSLLRWLRVRTAALKNHENSELLRSERLKKQGVHAVQNGRTTCRGASH